MSKPIVDAISTINGLESGKAIPHRVDKPWGWELWFANSPDYCAKWIHINPSKQSSMHLHVKKHETLIVVRGILTVEAIVGKKQTSYEVLTGEAFVVAPGFPHQLTAILGPVDLIEASTQHFESDSVKLY